MGIKKETCQNKIYGLVCYTSYKETGYWTVVNLATGGMCAACGGSASSASPMMQVSRVPST